MGTVSYAGRQSGFPGIAGSLAGQTTASELAVSVTFFPDIRFLRNLVGNVPTGGGDDPENFSSIGSWEQCQTPE